MDDIIFIKDFLRWYHILNLGRVSVAWRLVSSKETFLNIVVALGIVLTVVHIYLDLPSLSGNNRGHTVFRFWFLFLYVRILCSKNDINASTRIFGSLLSIQALNLLLKDIFWRHEVVNHLTFVYNFRYKDNEAVIAIKVLRTNFSVT